MLLPRMSASICSREVFQYSIVPSSRSFTSSRTRFAGSFKTENGLQIYHERKILPYTQKQLYAVVADTDSYQRFIPFVTSSQVLHHEGPGDIKDRPWLDTTFGSEDVHKMDHEMRIGVLGFDECWISNVTCEKFRSVSATSNKSNLFKALKTTWTLSPAPSNAPHPSSNLPQGSTSLGTPGQPGESGSSNSTEDCPTMVNIDLAWQFANPLYAAAAGSAFQRVSGRIMAAFEKRVKEIYGPGLQ